MTATKTSVQESQQTSESLFPPGWRIVPDQGLRRRQEGRLLMGGSPFRFLRLSGAGAKMVDRWFAGEELDRGRAAQKLAKRLVSSGMAHPMPYVVKSGVSTPGGNDFDGTRTNNTNTDGSKTDLTNTGDAKVGFAKSDSLHDRLTIVIPVKDDLEGLQTTLHGLDNFAVVIVDDGSATPISDVDLGRDAHGSDRVPTTTLLRNDQPEGPGSARNRGIASIRTEFIVLVDAGVRIDPSAVEQLSSHFADPDVVAVAPRVRSIGDDNRSSSMLDRYERDHSPLDLGGAPARVQPGSSVAYVPSACLALRSEALARIEHGCDLPFDPDLRYGEDVDLEWRLNEIGTIRYDPAILVAHPPRSSVGAFVRQRVGYGSAAGPLATRHGSVVAPFRTSPWSLSIILAVLGRWFGLAALLGAISSILMWRKLGDNVPDREVEAVRLTTTGHYWSAVALGETSLRTWWPLTLFSILCPLTRSPGAMVACWGFASRLWKHRSNPNVRTQAAQTALGVIDDLSYGYGVWLGSWNERSFRALMPDIQGVTGRSKRS